MRLVAEGLGYVYPSGVRGLGPVDLQVAPGERLLVCGPSGCGKSTLARLLVGLLQRHGSGLVEGRVRVDGVDPGGLAPAKRTEKLGFVGQVPSDQLVSGAVGEELALVLRWAGREEAARVAETLEEVGLSGFEHRDPRALSGGEQQRLVVGAALVGGAPVLVLDEPLAMLDPAGASALLALLDRLAAAGAAVVLVEHRLGVCLPWADRVLRLEAGQIAESGPPGPPPRTGPPRGPAPPEGAVVVELRDLHWAWGEVPALRGVSLSIRRGERVALVGANGAGKSTLLEALGGRIGPTRPLGRCVAVPQDPDLALYCASVRAELADGPAEAGRAPEEVASTVHRLAARFDLAALLDRSPQSLSRGQRMRVAVAAALACAPDLLLLDEPTAGQDHDHVEATFDALDAQGGLGEAALVFATHDHDLAARRATRIVELEAGQICREWRP